MQKASGISIIMDTLYGTKIKPTRVCQEAVDAIKADGEAFVLNTGSPHYVKQVADLNEMDVYSAGKEIRYNQTYQEKGINVNFV